jgi:hypothetical protein
MSLSQVFQVFPCQYHSTNAPYSFIHLPPAIHYVFLPVLQFSPVSIIPPMLHTHSLIYHRRCIMFLSQVVQVFPCQYHSTNARYSFMHLHRRCVMFLSQYFRLSPVSNMLTNATSSCSVIRSRIGPGLGTLKEAPFQLAAGHLIETTFTLVSICRSKTLANVCTPAFVHEAKSSNT